MSSDVGTGPLPKVGQWQEVHRHPELGGPRPGPAGQRPPTLLIVLMDLLVVLAAVIAAALLTAEVPGDPAPVTGWGLAAVAGMLTVFGLVMWRAWEPNLLGRRSDQFGRILRGTVTGLALLALLALGGLALDVDFVRPWAFGVAPAVGMMIATLRRAASSGRVAPMPARVPGRARPARGRARYPREELSRSARAWMLVPPIDAVMLTLPIFFAPERSKALLAVAALMILLLTSGRSYRARLHLSVLDELPWLSSRFCAAVAVVATVTALRHEQEAVTAFLVTSLVTFVLFVTGRILTTQVILLARRRGVVSHRTLLVGGGAVAADVAVILGHYRRYGLHVVGFVDDAATGPMGSTPWLGAVDQLDRIALEHRVTAIIVAGGTFVEEALLETVRRPLARSCEWFVVPRLHHLNTQAGLADHVGSIPVMRISNPALRGPAWALKRGFDVVTSAVALLGLLPLLVVCAVAVRLEGGPGVIFRQERVGLDGRIFRCLKFRSMRPIDPDESATRWSIAADDRVGPVGRILRKTSLDELPQLWNILRGDMTLVGPRPERPHFVDKFSAEIPSYSQRHRVRAGLTGFAQVSGLRGDTSIIDRARFDNYYIENWSLWMDAKVLIRTVGEVLFARGG